MDRWRISFLDAYRLANQLTINGGGQTARFSIHVIKASPEHHWHGCLQ